MIATECYKFGQVGLEPPAGTRKKEKSYCEILKIY